MTVDEARKAVPPKSPWRSVSDGKQYTVVGYRKSASDVEVIYSLTTDSRVQLTMPIPDFLASFTSAA